MWCGTKGAQATSRVFKTASHLATDADALEDTVAAQLVQHQGRVDEAGALQVVGNDAADKMRVGVVERVHQGRQLFLAVRSVFGSGETVGRCNTTMRH